ncbi:MAG TPA: PaaI family thioesterase [Dehalococcoidia bacterium]
MEIRPGHVRVRYEAREAFYKLQGVVQGGFLAAMLDDAMGPAAFTLLDEGSFAPTLEMKVSFVRPARAGPVIAEGHVLHQSRRFVHVEGRLTTEDGQLIATATATLVISRQKEEP